VKPFFAVLGVIFLAVVALSGIGVGLLAIRGNPVDTIGYWFLEMRGDRLDKESKAYADAAIPAIAAWSEKELLDRQSPELKQTLTQQQLDLTFQRLSLALGHLQKCEPAQGQSIMSGKQVKATYISKAIFEKGEAVIQLDLIKHGDQWQILGFKVNSPLLQQQPPQPH